jgi:hypothetical protein
MADDEVGVALRDMDEVEQNEEANARDDLGMIIGANTKVLRRRLPGNRAAPAPGHTGCQ